MEPGEEMLTGSSPAPGTEESTTKEEIVNLTEARIMAEELLTEHAPAVAFKWDSSRKRFGQYSVPGIISLSRPLTQANTRDIVRDVLLHEIAHHKAGVKAGHGRLWKAHAMALGTSPARCWDTARPEAKKIESGGYIGTCPRCGGKERAFRLGKRMKTGGVACGSCCRKYNYGKFSKDFAYTWRKAPVRRKAS